MQGAPVLLDGRALLDERLPRRPTHRERKRSPATVEQISNSRDRRVAAELGAELGEAAVRFLEGKSALAATTPRTAGGWLPTRVLGLLATS
jgi:hypothetical protein